MGKFHARLAFANIKDGVVIQALGVFVAVKSNGIFSFVDFESFLGLQNWSSLFLPVAIQDGDQNPILQLTIKLLSEF